MKFSTGEKLGIGFIVLAVAFVGWRLFAQTRIVLDDTVNAWEATRRYPIDSRLSYDPQKNPYDKKKDEINSTFASTDGQLHIFQYPNDSNKAPRLQFVPENRKTAKVYRYYSDELAYLNSITDDAFRHALARYAYSLIYGKNPPVDKNPWNWMDTVGLSDDQKTRENKIRSFMQAETTNIKGSVDNGTFHTDLMDKVMKALQAFRSKSGDIAKDPAKQDLARKVLEAASVYLKAVHDNIDLKVQSYLDEATKILTEDQKNKFIELEKAANAVNGRPPSRSNQPANGNRGNRANRGPAPASPNRGAAPASPPRGGRSGATTRGG